MYYIYKNKMSRQRHKNISYAVEVNTPNGEMIYIDGLNTLDEIAVNINKTFFNGFGVVSRAMVNNWVYYPNQPRRSFATNFNIQKCVL